MDAISSTPSFENTYSRLFGTPPPQSITSDESRASIVSVGRGFIGGFDLTMQTLVGCPAGCLFCYVPTGGRLTPLAVKGPRGEYWGFRVRHKRDVLRHFQKLLAEGALADKTLYWSGITDPYVEQPAVTRGIWQLLSEAPEHQRPRRIVVQTRFRANRDAVLMAHYAIATTPSDYGPAVVISYSIGTDRDDLIRAWERATPSYDLRMRTLEALCKAGLFVVATLSPLGLWNDLRGTLHQFKEWGVAYLTVLCFKEKTPSANTPPRFLTYLRESYPDLLDPAWQAERIGEMQQIFGVQRVLTGQAGFASLTSPHTIVQP